MSQLGTLTDHDVFDVTDTDCEPPADANNPIEETLNIVAWPACVTDTGCVTHIEPPVIVITTVPVRGKTDGFTVAVSVTDPLPEPDTAETVIQSTSFDTVHVVFDVTVTTCVPPPATGVHDVGDTVKVKVSLAAWVTVTICVTAGVPLVVVNVTVPVRGEVVVFAAACTNTGAFPDP